jgi:AGZA family xanthine/uracil permease-like MFS transporter
VNVTTTTQSPAPAGNFSTVDRFFKITERGSTVGTEIRGGLVTFFTMAYIIVVNPIILGNVPDGSGQFLGGGEVAGAGIPTIAATTALVAGVVTICMGLFANFPLAMAAGMGLNAVVAFSIATLPTMTWADAMGIIVLEGIVVLILVISGFREAVFHAVPMELKIAISVGIGLFIAFIGFYDAHFVSVPGGVGTPLTLGTAGSLESWPVLVFVIGLIATIVLMIKKVRGSILIAIVGATVLAVIVEAVGNIGSAGGYTPGEGYSNPAGWASNVPALDGSPVAVPNFGILGHFSLLGSFHNIGIIATVLFVFTLMIADFFDTMGTMVAVGAEANLLDERGMPPKSRQILVVDSLGAIAGGAGSVSSNTAYVESASGVGDGARTGLASIVTGIAFLLATFLSPLVAMVPSEAATPALVVVGFLMLTQITGINWRNIEVAIPAFLTIVLMPFTYSITTGIGAGVIAFVIIKLLLGKGGKVHPLLYVTTAAFILYFLQGPLSRLIL